MILALTLMWMGCDTVDTPVQPTLDVVANQITFKSVENLGAHHLIATISRTDDWEDDSQDIHEETLELAWNNWDSFHLRRVINGTTVNESLVSDGRAYTRSRGIPWETEIDAEPARLRVQTSWKVWDSAMDLFSRRLKLTETGHSIVDGRAARRFIPSLTPLDGKKRVRGGAMIPQSIKGEVWLDELTAVRLSADVKASATKKALTRTIHLRLTRSGIGENQPITPPAVTMSGPSQRILKGFPRRPSVQRGRQPRSSNP